MNALSTKIRNWLGRFFGAAAMLLLLPLVCFSRGRERFLQARALACGDLLWIGPIGKGLVSSWRLHQRLGLPDAGEASLDAEDERQRGWGFDSALLARFAWASVLGGQRPLRTEERWPLLGLWLDNLNHQDILEHLDRWQQTPACRQIAFVNPHCANLASNDPLYRCILNRSDLLLPDGSGVLLAGRLLGTPLRANSNGTDLFPVLCRYWQQQGARVYLLGGRDGVTAKVAARLEQDYPGLQIAGFHHGYFSEQETPALLTDIRTAKPDVLLVAMGVPVQDVWLAQHADELRVPLSMGVGGLFDFYSGRIERAPLWLRELGMEWAWRLAMEPGRMWRRYLVGNIAFLLRVARQRLQPAVAPLIRVHQHENLPPGDAVILANQPLWQDRREDAHALMLPLAGLSLIERTVIALVQQDVQHIHILLDLDSLEIQDLLGDGTRWGIRISWHHVGSAPLQQRLDALSLRMPAWVVAPGSLPETRLPTEIGRWMLPDGRWSGWARVGKLEADADTQQLVLPESALAFHGLSVRTPAELLQAQSRLISDERDLPPAYREIAHQVWVAPGVLIEPGVSLQGPLMIGERCLIRKGCRVGPNVVMGPACVLETDVLCQDTLLLADSYVSRQLTLLHVLAGAKEMHDVRTSSIVPLRAADALFTSIAPSSDPVSWRERLQALVLDCALHLSRKSLPTSWRLLSGHLRDVWHGERHLVGLPDLPTQQPALHPSLRSGAIRLSALMPQLPPLPGVNEAEQRRLTDLYGAATPSTLSWRQLYHFYAHLQQHSGAFTDLAASAAEVIHGHPLASTSGSVSEKRLH